MDANAERVDRAPVRDRRAFAQVEAGDARGAAVAGAARRAGDFAQALMDLGSLICTTKRPALCARCPCSTSAKRGGRGIQETLPVKAPKMVRPLKRAPRSWRADADGAVLLVQRRRRACSAT